MISETNHFRAWSFLFCQHRNESESPHWLQGADRQVSVSGYEERQTRPTAVAESTAWAARSPFPASRSGSQFPWWRNGDKDVARAYVGRAVQPPWESEGSSRFVSVVREIPVAPAPRTGRQHGPSCCRLRLARLLFGGSVVLWKLFPFLPELLTGLVNIPISS